jgi:hypothetical protein
VTPDHPVLRFRSGLEQNLDAQRFYTARGGALLERAPTEPPGGIPGRLNGHPMKLRCAWSLDTLCSVD